MRYNPPFVILLVMLMAMPAFGLEIKRGAAIEGGLVVLKAAPGSVLTANGTPLMVSPEGLALIGFHYNDTAPIEVMATAKDGSTRRLTMPPRSRQYETQRIDGLPPAMVTPPEDVLARISRERGLVSTARAYATPLTAFVDEMIWPVEGIITGVYGTYRILNGKPRSPHYGVDIAAPIGTEVIAPASGIIRMVEELYFTGWTVILDHGHGLSSAFLHLDSVGVEVGQYVRAGEALATVGSSGRSTGPHLDWRVNLFDKRLDPMLIAAPPPRP